MACHVLFLFFPTHGAFLFFLSFESKISDFLYICASLKFYCILKVPAEAVWYPGTRDSYGGKQPCECWEQRSSARVTIALNCWDSFLAPTLIPSCLPMQIHSQSITRIQRVICLKNIVSSKLALSHVWYSPIQISCIWRAQHPMSPVAIPWDLVFMQWPELHFAPFKCVS